MNHLKRKETKLMRYKMIMMIMYIYITCIHRYYIVNETCIAMHKDDDLDDNTMLDVEYRVNDKLTSGRCPSVTQYDSQIMAITS